MMLEYEYEKVVDEIVKHGVAVTVNKVVDDNYITNERKYVGCVVKLDFSEHDKVFEDKIAKLEKRVHELDMIHAMKMDEVKALKQRIAELETELEGKETTEVQRINLNDMVKVKLTPLGADIYYHQYDDLNKTIKSNGGTKLEPRMPEIDKDGYTKMQLHHFISLYGEYIGMCKPNVIEPLDITICE